jgi:hypothetical protein
MAAIPLDTVVDAARDRLTARCAGIATPDVTFGKAAPVRIDRTVDINAYVLHLWPEDVPRQTGTVIRRTHHMQARLWVRAPDDASESLFLALCDAVEAAFFGFQGMGIGMKSAAIRAIQAPAYIAQGNEERRQRVWELAAVEDYVVTLSE